MKKLLVAAALSVLMVSGHANAAAEVNITWEKPKEYTDVKPANESRKRFRERVFRHLEEYVTELAEKLPDGQVLNMTVTNVDLAGQVWPASFVGLGNSTSEVRVIKRIDIPRMKFSYELLDADKNQLQTAEVDLKDMGFQERINPLFKSESFRIEKNMLRVWFRSEFPQEVADNN